MKGILKNEFIKLFDVIVENIHNSYTAEEGRGIKEREWNNE